MTVRSVLDRTDHDGAANALTLAEVPRAHDRLALTRVDVWSVVKFAVVFWSAIGALTIGALVVLWTILSMTGSVAHFERFVTDLTGVQHFNILSNTVLGAIAVAILVLTAVCIAMTALMVVWFNTLSSLVGGIEVECAQVARRR